MPDPSFASTTRFFYLLFLALIAACGPAEEVGPEGFVLHPDFQLELIASEPLVLDPVDLKFDERGRAFVLEMPGYPLRDEESRLVLLQDTDGDGRYDQRKVFADKLQLASSFIPYREGMLVAAPPDLLYIRDTDNDLVADDYQVIMSGFSTGNLQHNYNGLTYGLDNWIYAANGGNSGDPYFVKDTTLRLEMRDDDFRFKLEPAALERVGQSSGGYGLAFDQWGHQYETHNVEHVSQLVFENRYLEDWPAGRRHALTEISDHNENGLARIYPVGEQETRVNHPEQSGYFSGSCGITFYGGNAFPEGFNNHLFVADVVLNLIHLDVLTPDDSAFKTSRMRDKAEFLASSDRAFRPVNLSVGPDGGLYVIDIHRAVIEHPEWIPDEIEANLDLRAGKDQGRIYRITPRDKELPETVSFPSRETEKLIAGLENPSQWVRMTAQRLLVENGDPDARAALEGLFDRSGNALAQLHALWALEGLGVLQDTILAGALNSKENGLQENAVKIAESRLEASPKWTTALIGLLEAENAAVRMRAALALSTLSEGQFTDNVEQLHNAFGQMLQDGRAGDQWSLLAVAAALKRSASLFNQQLLEKPSHLNDQQMEVGMTLARVIGNEHQQGAISGLLQGLHQSAALSLEEKAGWIDALEAGWQQNPEQINRSAVVRALENLENSDNIPIIRAAGKLRQSMGLPVSSQVKSTLAGAKVQVVDNTLPPENRLELLKVIKLDDFQSRKPLLYQLLDNRQPLILQKEALQQLWASDDPEIGTDLVALWPGLGPEARKGAGDILLKKSYLHDVLLTALEEGKIRVGELNFDLERRRTLLFWSEPAIQERAKSLFSDAGVITRKAAIDKMRPALELAGNPESGQELFAVHCGSCHQYGEMGQEVGPVLTEISRKSKASLLHDILDPNAAVDTRYLNHRVETNDGKIITGIVETETDSELNLLLMGGQRQTIQKENIKSFSSLGISLMPEGLEGAMSEQEMADLLAFLQQRTPSS